MNRIRELRILEGLTQAELAEKVGLNQTAIGKYERGDLEPSVETMKKLSSLFECSIDYLLGHSDDFGQVTIYKETKSKNSLSVEEQHIIDCLRNNPPYKATDWLTFYAELPTYMQESIFAELKGMHLGYNVSKNKKTKEK